MTTSLHYKIIKEPGVLLSAEEYGQLPDVPGWYTELDKGRVVYMPAVKDHRHGWILDNLVSELSPYVKRQKLGRLTYQQEGYDISQPGDEGETVWMPDLGFVCKERLPIVEAARAEKRYAPLAPDLAVEIVSPSQTRSELAERVQRWLAAGTRLMWVIWPDEHKVDVWTPDEVLRTLNASDLLDGLDVVAGFTMPVADLFTFA